jgi:Na+/melibiose symporter-like transporter
MTTREPDHGHLGDRPSTDRPGATVTAEPEVEHRIKRAKTSAAALALAIGSAAFVLTLLVLFFPVALILGVIGLLLGIVGFRATRKPGVTGKGVALAAILLSAVSILLGAVFAAGVVTVLNNESAVSRIEQQVENLRDRLPNNVDIPQS